jgi:acyl-CoA thioesterase-1
MLLRALLIIGLMIPGLLCAAPVILVFGDSLSASYGIPRDAGWVSLLDQRLVKEKFDYQIVNASISGETTAGGLSRINAALTEHRPAVVILELGANDGLRGLPLANMSNNLDKIITACQRKKARVLLIGMRLPPNYGMRYTQEFQDTYAALAKQHKLPLVPFLLAGVEDEKYYQADRLHPTAEAQPLILNTIWAALHPMLKQKSTQP